MALRHMIPMQVYGDISVLLAEDQPTTRVLVKKLLANLGFNDVDVAVRGSDALALMAHKKHSLVLSDWHMAGSGGLDLLKAVRADERLKKTPFIVTSVDMTPESIRLACAFGADGYLLKPYDAGVLKTKIETVFRKRPPPVFRPW